MINLKILIKAKERQRSFLLLKEESAGSFLHMNYQKLIQNTSLWRKEKKNQKKKEDQREIEGKSKMLLIKFQFLGLLLTSRLIIQTTKTLEQSLEKSNLVTRNLKRVIIPTSSKFFI
jgi:hypothetical protein